MRLPLVSIGVPVYNDEKWLRNTLDHLLAQEYKNIEMVITDDVSSDNSNKICLEYATKDPRIRFFQNKSNLGAIRNHALVLNLCKGDYFAWCSGHDLFHQSYIAKCVEILEKDESVVLCCSQSQHLDINGSVIKETKGDLDTRGLKPVERFKKILWGTLTNANIFYGLFKSNILAKSELHRNTLGGDLVFFTEISLFGVIAQLNEVLFYRKVDKLESPQQAMERWIQTIIQPKGFCLEAVIPWICTAHEYFKVINCSKLSLSDKELLFGEVITMCIKNFGWSLKQDVVKLILAAKEGIAMYQNHPRILANYSKELLYCINMAYIFFPNDKELHALKLTCLQLTSGEAKMDF